MQDSNTCRNFQRVKINRNWAGPDRKRRRIEIVARGDGLAHRDLGRGPSASDLNKMEQKGEAFASNGIRT
jgi:hypothetical protein